MTPRRGRANCYLKTVHVRWQARADTFRIRLRSPGNMNPQHHPIRRLKRFRFRLT